MTGRRRRDTGARVERGRRVLLRDAGRVAARDMGRHRGTMLVLLGAAFLVVELVGVGLLWVPPRFDSLAWEFATAGRTLDRLPMAALGLGLLTYGGTRGPRVSSRRLRLFALGFGLLAVLVALLAVLFVTAVPTLLQQGGTETSAGIRRAAIRHGVQSVVYPAAFGLVAVSLWRAGRLAA